jgi:U5 small nuclear ribonucleoprotein component
MENEQELYDEFGNYIGPDLDSDDSSSDEDSDASDDNENDNDNDNDGDDRSVISEMHVDHNALAIADPESSDMAAPSSSIVLHEDKVHYPSASTIYGPNVTTAILDEDTMDISEPIIPPEPTVEASHAIHKDGASDQERQDNQRVSDEYLTALCDHHKTKRCIALVGNLSNGKTTLIDLLLQHTLYDPSIVPKKYTDTLKLEKERQMSLQSCAVTLPLATSRKTHAITILDNPGHIQFHDESVSTLKLADGAVLVLDVVEGLTLHDEMLLRQIVSEGLPVVLVLNKLDRLIVDLKLPVEDAFYKIRNVIEEVNAFVKNVGRGRYPSFCLTRNVALGSAVHGWIVSLGSMAEMYLDQVDQGMDDDDNDNEEDGDMDVDVDGNEFQFGQGALGKNLTLEEFTKRLWGDCYLDPKTRRFKKRAGDCVPGDTPRTFCQFVLEPIYKIYTACLGESEKDASKILRSVGVHLSREQLRASSNVMLRAALEKFFADASGFVDLIVKNV